METEEHILKKAISKLNTQNLKYFNLIQLLKTALKLKDDEIKILKSKNTNDRLVFELKKKIEILTKTNDLINHKNYQLNKDNQKYLNEVYKQRKIIKDYSEQLSKGFKKSI